MARFSFAVFLLLVLTVATVSSEEVVTLTEADFDTQTATGSWIIEFYAPWCGHCKRLAPTWEEFATSVKGEVNVAKVDCTVHRSLATRFGIRGFPTIKFLSGGKLYDYQAARNIEAFTAFVKEDYKTKPAQEIPSGAPAAEKPVETKAEPAVQGNADDVVDLTVANFDQHIANGDWLVEFFAPWCGHCKRLVPTWAELATTLKGKTNVAKIDCTVHKEVCTRFGVRGYPTIKFIKDEKVYDFRGDRSIPFFTKFVETEYTSHPSVPVPASTKVEASEAPEAPKASEAPKAPEAPKVEVVKTEAPKAASEKPASDDSAVVILGKNNFDKTEEGTWLVEFYAPWCGHCKRLVPIWEDLAKSAKAGNNIAKVDCTVEKDLCTRFGIRGYPSIRLIKDDKLYEYKGQRTVEAFTAYLNSGYATEDSQPVPAAPKAHDEL